MSDFPPPIQAFMDAVRQVGGIDSIEPHKWYLPELPVEHFSLPQFADLPLGVLRRPCGIAAHEVLVAFKFWPQRTEQGWRAVEFLSWWVRDNARGGHAMQMRSLALPPEAAGQIQLGSTLSFVIELFVNIEDENMEQLLQIVGQYAEDLTRAARLYAGALSSRAP